MHPSLVALARFIQDTTPSPSPTGSTGTGGSTGGSHGSPITSIVLLVVIGLVAYMFLIRPQRRRVQQQQQATSMLEPGMEVLTRHGQYATVVAVDGDIITLEVAPGVNTRFVKGAIARVVTPDEPEPISDDADASDGGSTSVPNPDGPPAAEMIPDDDPGPGTTTDSRDHHDGDTTL